MFRVRNNISMVLFLTVALIVIATGFSNGEFRYETHGRRDPFVPLVGQDKPSVVKLEDVTSIDDIRLEGIATGPAGKRTAMINGALLKEKDSAGDISIISITNTSVKLTLAGNVYEVSLPQEGGKGE